MTTRREFIGRYRRAGNTRALFIPLELRAEMQALYGWKDGDYLIIVPSDGLLMIRKVDKTMLLDRIPSGSLDQRSK
jgi:hypothetical protein